MISDHPLFMESNDIQQNNLENLPEIQALQNLMYDDTPENIAIAQNNIGNKILQKGQDVELYLKQARNAYTEGINVKGSNNIQNSKLYSNRAFVNFKLKNYGLVIEDCLQSIKLNSSFIKPYYRLALSYQKLDKYEEALNVCKQALHIQNDCKEIQQLFIECTTIKNQQENSKLQNQNKLQQDLQEIFVWCRERDIILGKKSIQIPSQFDSNIFIDGNNFLHCPIIIYYPEFSQMDLIQNAIQDQTLLLHIEQLLANNLPWDNFEDYTIENAELYLEIDPTKKIETYFDIPTKLKTNYIKGQIYEIYRKTDINYTILQVLQSKDYIAPMVLELYMVSRKNEFYKKFIAENKFKY